MFGLRIQWYKLSCANFHVNTSFLKNKIQITLEFLLSWTLSQMNFRSEGNFGDSDNKFTQRIFLYSETIFPLLKTLTSTFIFLTRHSYNLRLPQWLLFKQLFWKTRITVCYNKSRGCFSCVWQMFVVKRRRRSVIQILSSITWISCWAILMFSLLLIYFSQYQDKIYC